jgi:hypothetical protein
MLGHIDRAKGDLGVAQVVHGPHDSVGNPPGDELLVVVEHELGCRTILP